MKKREIEPRAQWFIDRIGKRVFRNVNTCSCGVCKSVYENGVVISDSRHADYIWLCEGDSTAEGFPLRYFDTKKEALEFDWDNLKDFLKDFNQPLDKPIEL
jgi:hypothetical protein